MYTSSTEAREGSVKYMGQYLMIMCFPHCRAFEKDSRTHPNQLRLTLTYIPQPFWLYYPLHAHVTFYQVNNLDSYYFHKHMN